MVVFASCLRLPTTSVPHSLGQLWWWLGNDKLFNQHVHESKLVVASASIVALSSTKRSRHTIPRFVALAGRYSNSRSAMQAMRASSLTSAAPSQQQLLVPVSHKSPFTSRGSPAPRTNTSSSSSSIRPAQQQLDSSRRAQRRGLEPVAAAAPTAAASAAATDLKVVDVDLGDRSYPIYIGQHLLDDGARLRQHIPGNRVLIVTNTTIAPLYLQK